MAIKNYFTCNCCLFAQELNAEFLKDASLGIPDEERDNYIDCHCNLNNPLPDDMPEFNLKHRQSVGCKNWICGQCADTSRWHGHESCWEAINVT